MKGFNSMIQSVCTVFCIVALVLAGISTILLHVAFGTAIPAVVDMPTNLRTGLENLLHIDTLSADLGNVKTQAETAVGKCSNLTTVDLACATPPTLPADQSKADVSGEINVISGVFDRALNVVNKVANDKYLGIGDFKKLGDGLKTIRKDLDEMKSKEMPTFCAGIVPAMCEIRKESEKTSGTIAEVKKGITDITENDAVKQVEERADQYKGLVHIIPYVFWISAMFYLCFFCMQRPSCKAGCKNCAVCSVHTLLFIISLIISIVIFGAGIVIVRASAEYKLDSPFQGQPSITDLVDHIEVAFPDFYNLVLKDVLDGLAKVWQGYLVFVVSHILLAVHSATCCCGLYVSNKETS